MEIERVEKCLVLRETKDRGSSKGAFNSDYYKDVAEANVVIVLQADDSINIVKNRYGNTGVFKHEC